MERWFAGTAGFAVCLAAAHLMQPWFRNLSRRNEVIIGSFGGGMAVSYVFMHLLPELSEVGVRIFALSLVGFLVYYGLEHYLHRRAVAGASTPPHGPFALEVAMLFVYNWLIVYGTPVEASEAGLRSLPLFLAMMMHLSYCDFGLAEKHTDAFDRYGRFVLACAPIAGWLTALIEQKTNKVVNDVFVALLAGMVLYKTFSEELPTHEKSHYGWFIAGASVFAGLVLLMF